MRIDVTNEIADLNAQLMQLYGRLNGDFSPLMRKIGRLLEDSTRERFATKQDPNGVSWEQLAPSTLRQKKGGGGILVASSDLMKSITYRAYQTSVEVGTNEEHGKYHQTGTPNMPAREFLGLSTDDKDNIQQTLNEFLEGILHG